MIFQAIVAIGIALSLSVGSQAQQKFESEADQQRQASSFQFVQNQHGATLLEGIRPILTYQRTTQSMDGMWPRANYVHPLYDLDGEVLTEDFPSDHGHHRGVFWAWHQVWVGDRMAGDAWACRDFEWHVEELKTRTQDAEAELSTSVVWKSPRIRDPQGEMLPLVRERALIKVHPTTPNARWIDFEIALTALADEVRIGGSDDAKGYGGFSPRIKLSEDFIFSSKLGEVEPETVAIDAGPWINISNDRVGLAILCHPSNPGYPQPWILRRTRSMQNVAYPGREPIVLSRRQPLRLKYRLVVHRGNEDRIDLDTVQANYAAH